MELSTRDRIIQQLKKVYDPEIFINIYDLGLIYEISELDSKGCVDITMTLTSAWCPEADQIPGWASKSVEELDVVNAARVSVVFEPSWTPARASDAAKITMGWTEE